MPNSENLKPFNKGHDDRKHNGRPRKFVSTLKAQGYKLSEINGCIKIMLSMTDEQLQTAESNPQATTLELIIAAAIRRSIKQGNLSVMDTLITRASGKPKPSKYFDESPEIAAAKMLYDSLIMKGVKPNRALKKVIEAARIYNLELTEKGILDAPTIE